MNCNFIGVRNTVDGFGQAGGIGDRELPPQKPDMRVRLTRGDCRRGIVMVVMMRVRMGMRVRAIGVRMPTSGHDEHRRQHAKHEQPSETEFSSSPAKSQNEFPIKIRVADLTRHKQGLATSCVQIG